MTEKKMVVSFSGGRTSAVMCKLMIDMFGRKNVDFIYMDTGAEHSKTYEFIRKVNDWLGLELVCLQGCFNQELGQKPPCRSVKITDLKPDLKVFSSLVGKYGTPSIAGKWCTSRMKEDAHDFYCDYMYGEGNYQTWIGIRADEPRRLGKMGESDSIRYMAEISDMDKQDVLNFWKGMPFDLGIPEWLGNCVFCFKKSNLKLAAAVHDEPEMYIEWVNMINEAKDRPEQERESKHIMYRGKNSIQQVVAMFDGSTGAEIKARIRGSKMMEAESCSEGCEAFTG